MQKEMPLSKLLKEHVCQEARNCEEVIMTHMVVFPLKSTTDPSRNSPLVILVPDEHL